VLKVADHERRKRTVISQIKLVDGVLLILDLQGDSMQVLIFCEDESAVSRRTQLVSSVAGCDDPLILRNLDALGFHRCNLVPNKTDLMILKSLRKNPRKSLNHIASEIGVSVRTVERRITSMTDKNAFFHMLRLDFQKSDALLCSLIVSYKDERRKSKLDPIIASRIEKLFYSATSGKAASVFNFACSNVTEPEILLEWVNDQDGVAQTRMGFIREYILVSDWLDNEIERMIASRA